MPRLSLEARRKIVELKQSGCSVDDMYVRFKHSNQ